MSFLAGFFYSLSCHQHIEAGLVCLQEALLCEIYLKFNEIILIEPLALKV